MPLESTPTAAAQGREVDEQVSNPGQPVASGNPVQSGLQFGRVQTSPTVLLAVKRRPRRRLDDTQRLGTRVLNLIATKLRFATRLDTGFDATYRKAQLISGLRIHVKFGTHLALIDSQPRQWAKVQGTTRGVTHRWSATPLCRSCFSRQSLVSFRFRSRSSSARWWCGRSSRPSSRAASLTPGPVIHRPLWGRHRTAILLVTLRLLGLAMELVCAAGALLCLRGHVQRAVASRRYRAPSDLKAHHPDAVHTARTSTESTGQATLSRDSAKRCALPSQPKD